MAKVLQESPLTTPSARRNLGEGVHWRRLDGEVHLGYRKGRRSGSWLVRWRVTGSLSRWPYKQAPLGTADDAIKAGTLTFAMAEAAARQHVEAARLEAKAAADGPPITVRLAVENYIAERDARESKRAGRSVRSDAGQRLRRHVLGESSRGAKPPATALAAVMLHKLKESDLTTWLMELPDTYKNASRQRLVNDLKAALNAAYSANRTKLPAAVSEIIRLGLKAPASDDVEEVARDNQILSDGEVGRLLRSAKQVDEEQGWSGDLYRLLVVLAATGSRFSQVVRMHVRDVQTDNRRLLVPTSRKGKGRKQSHTAVPVGADVLAALAPALTGRNGGDVLLERWRHAQAPGGITWERDRRGAWNSASEFTRAWHRIRTLAELPAAVPYAFRHSSIVRGISAGLPIRLVAALHDTSTQMIERHYSRWITDGLDELAASAVVPLVQADSNVVPMAAAG